MLWFSFLLMAAGISILCGSLISFTIRLLNNSEMPFGMKLIKTTGFNKWIKFPLAGLALVLLGMFIAAWNMHP